MNFLRKENFGLSRFTTIQIGGVADCVYFPLNRQGIVEVFHEIRKEKKSFFILGGGSNVVIEEGKLDYAVIMTSHLTHYRFKGQKVEVECGVSSSNLCELTANNDLSGLEFCYGLPGSIGGAVFMNAKAYGTEIGDLIEEVEIFDYERGTFSTVSGSQCEFDYKHSLFQKKPYLIYKIKFSLIPAQRYQIQRNMEKYRMDRAEKGHFLNPSAGCAFKNNYQAGIPSGKLIDDLGLKGFQIGGIKVSEQHANFLVNMGGARFEDYKKMIDHIREKVKQQKQIELEREIRFLPEK
jgi:UDP-N-acetylmuramate dehydrogenase